MTRKIAAILAAAALALSLGACSDDNEAPAPTVTITAEPEVSVDEIFVSTLRSEAPGLAAGASDAELVELGNTTCGALDTFNGDPEALFYALYAEDPTLDYGDVGTLVGASIVAYCPEYSGNIDMGSDA